MQIGLVGTGQMGQAVRRIAEERGHAIAATYSSDHPLVEAASAEREAIDLFVDFSLPGVARAHFSCYADWDACAVVGTTGWYDEIDAVREELEAASASVLYAPNFSIGVAIARRAVEAAARMANAFEQYDPYVHEMHHTRKADSPSGTALMLADTILGAVERKTRTDAEAQHGPIDPDVLHVSSTRAGAVFGEHTAGFDSEQDRVEVVHRAKGREGFALGAVQAAEWLHERRPLGLLHFDDMLDDIL